MTDVFAIEDEITLAIVKQLKVELLAKERLAVLAAKRESLESYNLYLKGRFYWAQRPQGIAKAIEYFETGDRQGTHLRTRARRTRRLLRYVGVLGERDTAANRSDD